MALTVLITKQSVVKLTNDDYQVAIHVVVKDETEVVLLEKDYSERYYSQLDVDTVRIKLQDQLIADWDKYIAEENIKNAPQFDTVVSQIQVAANTYVNQ